MATLKEKTAKGLFWAGLNNGTMQILNAVIGIFLARLLSPADYGLVGMITIFSAIAGTLQESGFTSALINMKEPKDSDYNAVFWFSAIVCVVLYVILFFCAPLIAAFYHQPALVTVCRVAFLSLPLSVIGIVPQAYLSKYLIVKPVTIQRIIVLIISGTVGIIMAFKGMAYWSLVIQQLLYTGLQSIGKYMFIPWRPSLHVDFSPIRKMFGFSSKIMITNIISQISQNILTVIFGRLFPVKTVGNFTQGWKWNNMMTGFVGGMLGQVSQPVFATIQTETKRQLAVLRKLIRFTSFLAFPCMLGMALIAPEFIVLLISDKWIDSVPILQVLCIGGAFLTLYTPLQQLIISHGRSDVFMWINILQITLQIVIILCFASKGIMVMVWIYSIFTILYTFVWQQCVRKSAGYTLLSMLKDTMPFLLATLAAVALGWFAATLVPGMFLKLIVKIIVTALAYFVIMKVAGAKIMDECIDYLFKKFRK